MIHVIYNAEARGGRIRRQKDRIRAALDTSVGRDRYQWHETASPEEGIQKAARAEPGDLVVAAGGDGSVNIALQGIAHSGYRAALGVIPVGTGNDFAYGVGIPASVDGAVSVLAAGQTRAVDVGQAVLDGADPLPFVNVIGIGFDAAASIRSRRRKFLPGVLRYLVSSLETLATWEAPKATLTGEGLSWSRPLMFATFGNAPRSGGGFFITPFADPYDGLMDVCVVQEISVLKALRVIPRVMKGTHTELSEVQMGLGEEFRLEVSAPVPVHADGEIVARACRTVVVGVQAGVLRVATPSGG